MSTLLYASLKCLYIRRRAAPLSLAALLASTAHTGMTIQETAFLHRVDLRAAVLLPPLIVLARL